MSNPDLSRVRSFWKSFVVKLFNSARAELNMVKKIVSISSAKERFRIVARYRHLAYHTVSGSIASAPQRLFASREICVRKRPNVCNPSFLHLPSDSYVHLSLIYTCVTNLGADANCIAHNPSDHPTHADVTK